MELQITTDLNAVPQSIDFNFETLKAEITDKMAVYNAMVVTEDAISDAKSVRADLNKLKSAIDDRRKQIKKQWNKPYTAFEEKTKELTAIVDKSVGNIDRQIKDFEQQEKDKKLNELKAYYDNVAGNLSEIIAFDVILNPKWDNKGMKLDALKKDIDDKLTKAMADVKTIGAICKPYVNECIDVYCKSLDFSAASARYAELKERDKRMQNMQIARETFAQESQKQNVAPAEPQTARTVNDDPLCRTAFCVTAKRSMLIALKKFLEEGGYQYEQLKK